MDDDLLVTNSFIPLSFNTGADISNETKRFKVNQYITEQPDKLKPDAMTKAQPPIPLPILSIPDTLEKEERIIISINSNQRSLTAESNLDDPYDYLNYVSAENFAAFEELYNLAKDTNRTVLTYDEYVANYGVPVLSYIENMTVRSIVNNLLFETRDFPVDVTDINADLLSLVTYPAANTNARSDYAAMANALNAFVMSGSAFNPINFWRPFYFTGVTDSISEPSIKQVVYKDQLPNRYSITLPRIVDHVKSIRLVSTEIPNTVNNITERNNIITIQLKYVGKTGEDPIDVPLDPTESQFNFILIKLDIGVYTLDTLIPQMKRQINAECARCTLKKYADLFDVTWDPSTGIINIVCNRKEVTFHLKFYSELTGVIGIVNPGNPSETLGKSHGVITAYARDLWFLLGFPWPYEISSDGSNKYTSRITNQVNFGYHEVFSPAHISDDIFDRDTGTLAKVDNTTDTLNTFKPYKFPDISVKYIYLAIRDLKSINHVNQFNGVIEYKDSDIFAKILLSSKPGDLCYNTFVDNPLIFLNAKDKIETFDITWVDEQGSLVDFNKVDHSFTLEIVHYVTQLERNGYSTTLGAVDRKSYPAWLSNN
jgi:hypothetical protein